jgi:hypothetical protein
MEGETRRIIAAIKVLPIPCVLELPLARNAIKRAERVGQPIQVLVD